MIYSSIGIIAIIINLIINRDVISADNRISETPAQKAYRYFIWAMMSYLVSDAMWGLFDAYAGQTALYIDTVIYFITMYLAVMLWSRYAVRYLDDRTRFAGILIKASEILLYLEFAALLVNHFYHFFFWVDEAGDYHAYAFRYAALVIQIILFLVTSKYAFSRGKNEKSEIVRNRYRTIGMFGITMCAAIVLQIFYPLMPLYAVGYLIGTCLIHSYIIEDENAELRRKADEANQAKTSFLFNMSHDIRTPMNAILGYTDIGMRHTDNDEIVKDSFGKIKISGVHLLNLINDILEMSRIESGTLELAENPMNINDTIVLLENMGKSLAETKNVDFSVETSDITDPFSCSDELHINEVLINLVSNAIKYTQSCGKVNVRVEQNGITEDGRAVYRFTVADTGIGMSEEFQKHLFEAFSREKSVTVSRIEGAGLGLSIVKRIVDMAGGKIGCESKPGEGSTFTVEVPFRIMGESDIAEYKKQKAETAEQIPDETDIKGLRILLVEDNEMNREIATDILSEAGLEIETAEDGEIAVEEVKYKGSGYYDLILMDIQMPVMNGYEATRAIRALPGGENIPIIALSANAFEEDRQKSLESGMNDHIAKPIDPKALFEAIHRVMK